MKLFSDLTDHSGTIYPKITLCALRHPFTVFVATSQPSPRCLFVPPLKTQIKYPKQDPTPRHTCLSLTVAFLPDDWLMTTCLCCLTVLEIVSPQHTERKTLVAPVPVHTAVPTFSFHFSSDSSDILGCLTAEDCSLGARRHSSSVSAAGTHLELHPILLLKFFCRVSQVR